jgi:pimeloyl-ACP methyl ester carboxylesterase
LLDGLAIRQPVVFCGLSMGGYIAWQFWKRHANRLAALVLCDTRAAADSPDAARGRLASAEQVLNQGTRGLVDTLIEKLFSKSTVQTQPAIVSATRQVMLDTSPVGISAALRGMAARPDMSGELPKVSLPALVLCGEHDVISPTAEMRDLAKRMPDARFVEIPRSGHMSPLEQPELVNAELDTLLRSL